MPEIDKGELVYKRITWEEISPVWNEKLWTYRENHPHSSMTMEGNFNTDIRHRFKWSAFGCIFINKWGDKKLVGCNAGHRSAKHHYRTRGLYVDPLYRGHGIAVKLFDKLEHQAKAEGCRWIWSFPRLAALPTYQKAGFDPYGDPDLGEFDHCVKAKKDLSVIDTCIYGVEHTNWNTNVDSLERQGYLLGQNEEVRGNRRHVTTHWVNDLQIDYPTECLERVTGNLKDPRHVL